MSLETNAVYFPLNDQLIIALESNKIRLKGESEAPFRGLTSFTIISKGRQTSGVWFGLPL